MRESMQKSAGPVQRRAKEPAATKTQHENDLAQSPRVVTQRKAMGDGIGGASAPMVGGSGRGGLPGNLTRGIAALSGMDLSDVKVHRNSAKPAQFKALAFAQDNTIHLGPGQEKHLPHEAWHIVQQRQGRVKADVQMKGGSVNTDSKLEREADLKGAEAAQVGNSLPLAFASTDPGRGSGASNGVIQLNGGKNGPKLTSTQAPANEGDDVVEEEMEKEDYEKNEEREASKLFCDQADHMPLPTHKEVQQFVGSSSVVKTLEEFHKSVAQGDSAKGYAALVTLVTSSIGKWEIRHQKKADESRERSLKRKVLSFLKERATRAMADYGRDKNALKAYSKGAEKSSKGVFAQINNAYKAANAASGMKNEHNEMKEQFEGTRDVKKNWQDNENKRAELLKQFEDDSKSITSKDNYGITVSNPDQANPDSTIVTVKYDSALDRIVPWAMAFCETITEILDIFNINNLLEGLRAWKEGGRVKKRVESLKALTFTDTKKEGFILYSMKKLSSLATYLRISAVINILKFVNRAITFVSAGLFGCVTETINVLISGADFARKLFYNVKGIWKLLTKTKGEARKFHAGNLYEGLANDDPEYQKILMSLTYQKKAKKKWYQRGKAKEKKPLGTGDKGPKSGKMNVEARDLARKIKAVEFARKNLNGPALAVATKARSYLITQLAALLKSKPAEENHLLGEFEKAFEEIKESIPTVKWEGDDSDERWIEFRPA